jgi:hypothetical protein
VAWKISAIGSTARWKRRDASADRRPPGGRQRLIRAELLVQPGGDLQVQRRRQRQRALGHRQLPRLLEPVHALGAQLVDRPELMQRSQVPELQPVRAGDGRRPGERVLRRLQVALPRHPADHLQGLAYDLGQAAVLGRAQRGPGELVRLGQAALADRDLRRAGVDLCGVGSR